MSVGFEGTAHDLFARGLVNSDIPELPLQLEGLRIEVEEMDIL